ncbi:Predicted oxidoreductase, contains short-chain dehydrogenase (SDR) and DUF2520 domains [Nonlabens sp. Hel1_33_55]|uniref:Rossmann-like and DUF2520 domain-containing protein n=1 Tax=Nonlabens sp. Hel1_33_55 TaxID=1336802 RepID=UPI000875C3D1|nr:DUF2520 domain-containing protein [Nonlabens sp. Hel1_33_55]SCY03568.1 Predicted oxidoreductase, contains short-chain dehydrogenase (SDR) and DUF2520 domains [Nonlabens sp. Hel1_33_55]
MITVFVIGTGNLGKQLCVALESDQDSQIKLMGYTNHSLNDIPQIKAPLFKEKFPKCDLYLLAVPDDSIEKVSASIPANQPVAHMSGSVPMSVLDSHDEYGVLYIPQTFNKYRQADLEEITICLESGSMEMKEKLWMVAGSLSRKRTHINSTQRQQLHLAAVYMNNFVNHCYYKSAEILKAADLDPKLLEGLQTETLENAKQSKPHDAQTGPARRGDSATINRHLEQLKESDQAMYLAISESIKRTYED